MLLAVVSGPLNRTCHPTPILVMNSISVPGRTLDPPVRQQVRLWSGRTRCRKQMGHVQSLQMHFVNIHKGARQTTSRSRKYSPRGRQDAPPCQVPSRYTRTVGIPVANRHGPRLSSSFKTTLKSRQIPTRPEHISCRKLSADPRGSETADHSVEMDIIKRLLIKRRVRAEHQRNTE